MDKYIFRQVAPEHAELIGEFDGDTFTAASGDYCNTLFIVGSDRISYYNGEEYRNIQRVIEDIINGFEDGLPVVENAKSAEAKKVNACTAAARI